MNIPAYPHTGFLLINKPEGMTSASCVSHIKRILKQAGYKTKIGHSGTLDSFATGLLIIGIGREATRELTSLLSSSKTYKATAKLGEMTDTLDKTGNIVSHSSYNHITLHSLKQAAQTLQPTYLQTPPLYSALKHEGSTLSDLVRAQKMSAEQLNTIIEGKQREVTIFELSILECTLPFFSFEAHVSKGTYIRSLANDIAQRCMSIATTVALERTAIGEIKLSQATNLLDIKTEEDVRNTLISKEIIVGHLRTSF